MTESEAIKEIRENMLCDYCIAGCDECDIESCSNKDAFSVAIKALEEVQQYRKIGTPEECRKSVEICKAMAERRLSLENIENYMKFEDECVKRGFTFNSLLEAREKQTARKPLHQGCCDKIEGAVQTSRIIYSADIECLCNQKRYNEAKQLEEDMNILISAMEKQVPKEPTDRCMYKECPACGEVEIQFCKYCPSCGQKLDWRNEE